MKHFLCRHIFIYVCVMFFCVLYVFFVLCLITKVLCRSIMALLWNRGEGYYISRTANLRKISVIAPLDIKIPARLRTGKSALLPTSGHNWSCPPPESAKLRDFFLHAATRWHSASYARFKRKFRKFLQNFFAKKLVCVPKVRTFALAKQK